MSIANYAKNFDSYDGQKFVVEPASIARGDERFVKSTMTTGSDSIAFNYRMHQAGGEWKILDVYLAGNISQMAQKRSDFSATLSARRPAGKVWRRRSMPERRTKWSNAPFRAIECSWSRRMRWPCATRCVVDHPSSR